MKDNKLPDIPYNLPIVMDIDSAYSGHPEFAREARDMFFTMLKSGDIRLSKYQHLLETTFKKDKGFATSVIDSIIKREQRAKELQKKEWDVEYIRENGFEYFPTDEYLKETIFKGKPFFKGVRDYQVIDAYMLSKSTNMLITHGLRLGKTMITTMGILNNPKINNGVIIAPKSTLPEWKTTMNEWTEGRIKAKIVSADFKPKENVEALEEWYNGEVDFIITNIDHFVKYQETFGQRTDNVDLLLVDEAHFLANRNQNEMQLLSGKKANMLLLYRKQNVKFCWLVTGTPTKKYEYEILALYYFMSPSNKKGGKIKLDNYKWFFDRFCHLDSIPSPANGYQFDVSNRPEYQAAIRELNLNHRIHRTTRDEFPNNNEMMFDEIVLDMNAPQKKAYKSISGMLKAMFLEIDNALARDTYLRQISLDHRLIKRSIIKQLDKLENHEEPEYVDMLLKKLLGKEYTGSFRVDIDTIKEKLDGKYGFDKKGAKSEWILAYLKENKEFIQGNKQSDSVNLEWAEWEINQQDATETEKKIIRDKHLKNGRNPIIIYSQFKQFLHFFRNDMLETPGLKDMVVEVITGDNAKDRENIRLRLQNGEIDVLLVQTDTVKVGTALFRANTAIECDSKFSNQDMTQLRKRIEHPDSTDLKLTYQLLGKNSIDYKVRELVQTYDENTRYMNEQIMADITGANQSDAQKVFEDYLKNISK